jgi:hypothetical protein
LGALKNNLGALQIIEFGALERERSLEHLKNKGVWST